MLGPCRVTHGIRRGGAATRHTLFQTAGGDRYPAIGRPGDRGDASPCTPRVIMSMPLGRSPGNGELAGVDIPIKPSTAFLHDASDSGVRHWSRHFHIDSIGTDSPAELGGCLLGPKDEDSTFNTNVDWEHLAESVEQAVVRLPLSGGGGDPPGMGGPVRCSRTAAPSSVQYRNSGASRRGRPSRPRLQHGPIVGKLMAEMILTGRTSMDISPLGIERLLTGKFRAGTDDDAPGVRAGFSVLRLAVVRLSVSGRAPRVRSVKNLIGGFRRNLRTRAVK